MSENYGEMLAAARKSEGRSQAWLAETIGVSRVHLSLVETGARKPFPASTTMAAASALDMSALPLLLESLPIRGIDAAALKDLSVAAFRLLAALLSWLPVLGSQGATIVHGALDGAIYDDKPGDG